MGCQWSSTGLTFCSGWSIHSCRLNVILVIRSHPGKIIIISAQEGRLTGPLT